MRTRLVIFLFSCVVSLTVFAQREIDEESKPSFKDRAYFGGGLGFNGGTDAFGNRFVYFALNPIMGYMVTPKFSVGTGVSWQQYNYTDAKIKITQYGLSPFMRYNFGKLFSYAEYNLINTPAYLGSNASAVRKNYDRLLLGLGYSQPLGIGRGAINGMALYDVLYKQSDRTFASPWVFRIFVSF
jgi:hypothetical protein